MKKLLSLPPNVVESFHEVTGLSHDEYFCTCDPIGHRLGSGGGTTWVLQQAEKWLQGERCIILHAGGQSKRLPSYAVSGKVLTPIPVFRWERGQRLSQTLMDLQLPLYERMMEQAPRSLTTMIVSGDVYIRAAERIGEIPEADVVCYGLWLDASIAKNHGVFVSDRRTLETDVAEAFDGDADGVAEGPLLPDGYRHLDVERQGGAAVEEAQHCGQRGNR